MDSVQNTNHTAGLLIARALDARGFTRKVFELPHPLVEFTAPNGWKWLTLQQFTAYPFIPNAVHVLARNKEDAGAFAALNGVNTPKTMRYLRDDTSYVDFLEECGQVVVKPLDSSGSRGVTLNITDTKTLGQAVQEALNFSSEVLIQQQVAGDEIRLTIAGGEVVSVLLRDTAKVIGDGETTLEELVRRENAARKLIESPYLPYPELTEALVPLLEQQGKRVPQKDEIVELNQSTMVGRGASIHNIAAEIHPSYVETARNLAQALNPAFLVIDMIIQDYRAPRTDDNYAFIEFNTGPSMKLYYAPRTGEPYDMVRKLADMIEDMSKEYKND